MYYRTYPFTIPVKADKEESGKSAGDSGIYLCHFQWIMKLNNYEYVIEYVISPVTKYIYIIRFSNNDYRICEAKLALKLHVIYLCI